MFELSHNGKQTRAESVLLYETEDAAVMNMAVGSYDPATQKALVAAGLNEKCQVYEMQMTRTRRKSGKIF